MNENKKNFLDDLTEEQRQEVWDLLVYTIKEMREDIAQKIENNAANWKIYKNVNNRKVFKAFKESAQIARGEVEI